MRGFYRNIKHLLCAIFVFCTVAFAPNFALAAGGDTYEVIFYCANGELATLPNGNPAMFVQELEDPADFDYSQITVPTTCDGKKVSFWKSGAETGLSPSDITTGGYIYYRFVDRGHTSVVLYPDTYSDYVKVTLNNQGATTAGTTAYYYKYNIYNGSCYYFSNSSLTTCLAGATDGTKITIPTKTGYTFGGYYTKENGGGTQYVNASGVTVNNIYKAVSSDITLYAKWNPICNKITIVDDGINDGETIGYLYKQTGLSTYYSDSSCSTKITSIKVPTASKALFTGLYTGKIGGDYAQCANSNGVLSASASCNISGETTWYALFDCMPGYEAVAEDMISYYCEPSSFVISYNANGGTGSMANQSFTYDVAKNLLANTFTRTGYAFTGWNTAADGSGTSYADKASVKNLATGGIVTLYAKWTIISVTCAAGTYLKAGGTTASDCVKCPKSTTSSGSTVGAYCPGGTFNYNASSNQGLNACPVLNDSTRMQSSSYPNNDDGGAATMTSSNIAAWYEGQNDISDCLVTYTFSNSAGTFTLEAAHYSSSTGRYDNGGEKYYTTLKPGYYLTTKYSDTYCDTSAPNYASRKKLYRTAYKCPADSYCPGYASAMPLCSSTAETYGTTMGKFACPDGYIYNTTSGKTSASACQIQCPAGTMIETLHGKCTTPSGGWWASGSRIASYGNFVPVNYCMDGYTNSGTATTNHDAQSDCTKSVSGASVATTIPARYIRLKSAGNTVNDYTNVVEIQAFASSNGTGTNLLSGKGSTDNLKKATDGTFTQTVYASTVANSYLTWDMGNKQDIGSIKFAMHSADARTYKDVQIEVSADGSNWTTVLGPRNIHTPKANATDANPELLVLAGQTKCSAGTYAQSTSVSLGSTKSCSVCPTNASSAEGATECTCNDGYSYNGGTTTTTNECVANIYKITLNMNGGTANGAPEQIYEKPNYGWYNSTQTIDNIGSLPIKDKYVFNGFFTEQNGTGTQVIASDGRIVAPNFLFDKDTTIFAHYIGCSCDSSDESVSSCSAKGTSSNNDNACYYTVTCADGYSYNGFDSGSTTYTAFGNSGIAEYTATCKQIGAQTGYVCPVDTVQQYISCYTGNYMATMDASGNYVYNGESTSGNSCQNCPADAAYCPGGTSAPLYYVTFADDIDETLVGNGLYANVNGEYYGYHEEEYARLERLPQENYPSEQAGKTFNGYWTQSQGGEQYIDANGNFLKGPSANIGLHAQWVPSVLTIKYYQDDTYETLLGTQTCTYGSACKVGDGVTLPEKDGFAFVDWYSENTGEPYGNGTEFDLDDLIQARDISLIPIFSQCAAGTYEQDGVCVTCPSNSSSEAGATECTCNAGYMMVEGTCVEPEFTITTTDMAAESTFSFEISASGTFYVDFDDGKGTRKIEKPNTTKTPYSSAAYADAGTHTIKMYGDATGYSTSFNTAAISFKDNKNIKSVDGSLGSIFGGSASGMFNSTFSGCTSLQSIPETLFSGVTGSAGNMFSSTFSGCTSLQSIPETLFSGVTGSAGSMFSSTFSGCTSLQSIPETLFSGVTGSADYMFNYTFNGCTSLQSIPETLFSGVTGSASGMFSSTFSGCTSLQSIPETLFSGVTGSAGSMFSSTFSGCTSLQSIPETLFSGVTGSADYMFNYTFNGCTSLQSIPETLFSGVTGSANNMFYSTFRYCTSLTSLPNGLFKNIEGKPLSNMFVSTFNNCSKLTGYIPSDMFEKMGSTDFDSATMSGIFTNTALDTQCPAGMYQYITGFESAWNGKVSCVPCPSNSSSEAGATSCTCNDGYNYDGGTTTTTNACVANQYTVTFNANGGSGTMANQTFTYGEPQNLTTNVFTRAGYEFKGWNDKPDGSGTAYADKAPISNLLNNITLYAQWTPNTIFLTYFADSAKIGTQTCTVGKPCTVGDGITLPTKTGYTFSHWGCSGVNECDFDPEVQNGSSWWDVQSPTHTTVNDTINMYAKWTQCAAGTYEQDGVCVTCPSNSSSTAGATSCTCNDGYNYNGGTTTTTNACVANQYTVTFNANGGMGSMASQTFTYGVAQNLTANAFTRTGYTFGGWNTAADGSGIAYADKASISNLLNNITLYAQWSQCAAGKYSANGTCVTCPKGSYCANGIKNKCSSGTYADKEGMTECTACPAGSNLYKGAIYVVASIDALMGGNVEYDSIDSCAAIAYYMPKNWAEILFGVSVDEIKEMYGYDPNADANKRGMLINTCGYDASTQQYTKNCYGQVSACDGSYYTNVQVSQEAGLAIFETDTLSEMLDTYCVPVEPGYWSPGLPHTDFDNLTEEEVAATLVRHACPTGLTTIGYGAGADEAGDCGRVLHVDGEKLYLRSTEKTDVSLHVKVDGVTFFGNMVVGDRKISAGADKTLKIKHNGQIYSVYDDSVN